MKHFFEPFNGSFQKLAVFVMMIAMTSFVSALQLNINTATENKESGMLFDKQGVPNASLKELLNVLGYKGDFYIDPINDFMQKNLLRRKERWDLLFFKHEDKKQEVVIEKLLEQIGMYNEVSPSHKNYEGAIVYGALLSNFRSRLNYLVELWKQGITFKQVILLGGERALVPEIETPEEFISLAPTIDDALLPKNEYEMMCFLWKYSDIPQDLRSSTDLLAVNTPNQIGPDGQIKRPTTDDTIKDWLKTYKPKPSSYLLISNAPFIQRQDLVAQALLPHSFQLDTVGPSKNATTYYNDIGSILDELARLVYQTKVIRDQAH